MAVAVWLHDAGANVAYVTLYIICGKSQAQTKKGSDTMGERIRICREARGLTQEELAETCEVSRVYITQLEQGLNVPTGAGQRMPLASQCRA